MTQVKTQMGRRAFIRNSSLSGGGLILGFAWLNSCTPKDASEMTVLEMPEEWFEINAYLKIGDNGLVTIMSPNPEGGQNVKTSMPMIVADELDINWEHVIVEQAPLNTELYRRQFIGGSQAIRQSWSGLRMAGASARYMLCEAASRTWNVPIDEINAEEGFITHTLSGKSLSYGALASQAAKLDVPKEIMLKDSKDFKIIGTSKKNVDGKKIFTGQPLFGIDTYVEGMLTAMIVHPPAFGA